LGGGPGLYSSRFGGGGQGRPRPVPGRGERRGTDCGRAEGPERLRLRSHLLLSALREDLRRGERPGEGPREPSGQIVRAPARVSQELAGRSFLSTPSPRSVFCTAMSCWMPLSAAAISRFISSSLKGVCSAVPCTSTKSPRPVFTTFMSTSAFESSS